MRIRSKDLVEVISGDDKGVRGKVARVDRRLNMVVVEGVNRVFKHVRRSQKNPQGGRLSLEMPIAASKVKVVCSECNQATRTGVKVSTDGTRERVCKKCGASLGAISAKR